MSGLTSFNMQRSADAPFGPGGGSIRSDAPIIEQLKRQPFEYGFESRLRDSNSVLVRDPQGNQYVAIMPLITQSSELWRGVCTDDAALTAAALIKRSSTIALAVEDLRFVFPNANCHMNHLRVIANGEVLEHGKFFAALSQSAVKVRSFIPQAQIEIMAPNYMPSFTQPQYLRELEVGEGKLAVLAAGVSGDKDVSVQFLIYVQENGIVTRRHELNLGIENWVLVDPELDYSPMRASVLSCPIATTKDGKGTLETLDRLEQPIVEGVVSSMLVIVDALRRGTNQELCFSTLGANLQIMKHSPNDWWRA